MPPQDLAEIIKYLRPVKDKDVLVGTETADDAAVYKLDNNTALVQTLDFFTPIVDNPYDYGAIAAANSLSDIYAMGGKPIMAMNIVAYPCDTDPNIMGEIMRGGQDKALEAGIEIIGGHSVSDSEPKYGLAVTGLINPQKIILNSTAKENDLLVLTKPIGFGIMATGLKANQINELEMKKEIECAARLNRNASEAMIEIGVNACTDITGFGLLGHCQEMALNSGLEAEINTEKVPYWPRAKDLAASGFVPGGAKSNKKFLGNDLVVDSEIEPELIDILFDPQTSGGLLISIVPEKVDDLMKLLLKKGESTARIIGALKNGKPGLIKLI